MATPSGAGTPEAAAPFSADWRERIMVPAAVAGVLGAGFGLLSRHRVRLGAFHAAATYAANISIVAGCYGGEMGDSTGAQALGMNKNLKHQWSSQEDEHLVYCLLRLVQEGSWKADNGFRTGYLAQLEKWLHERIPNCELKGNPHIESRLKTLKRQFHAITEMLGPSASGFGWSEKDTCVVCEKDIYDNWVKSHPTAKGLRNKPFPFLEELLVVFGKDRATGENSESPADAVERFTDEEMNSNDANPDDTNTVMDEQSPGNNSTERQHNTRTVPQSHPRNEEVDNTRGSKRRRTGANEDPVDSVSSCMLSMQAMFASANDNVAKLASCFQFMQDDAARKQKVFEELQKFESIPFEDRMRAGALICSETNKSNYFFSLPEEYRQSYVQMVIDGTI